MAITVNGTNIENSVIEKEIERLRPDYEKSVPAQKPEMVRFHLLDQAKKNLIDRVLISQASKDQGPDVSAKKLEEVYSGIIKQNGGEKKFLEKYKLKIEDIPGVKNDLEHQLKHEGLINSVTEDSEVSLDEAKDFYEKNPKQFIKSGRVMASHIVANVDDKQSKERALEVIQQAKEKLEAGDAFKEVAEKFSSCPSKGGSLGWFPRGQMVQEFEDVVFKMEIGQRSDVFLTPFGYHIAIVEDKEEDMPIPFDEVKDRLLSQLKMNNAQSKMEKFVQKLRENATIKEHGSQ